MSDMRRMDRRRPPQKSKTEREALLEEIVHGNGGAGSSGGTKPPGRTPKKKNGFIKYIVIFLFVAAISYGGLQVYNFVSSPLNASDDPANQNGDVEPVAPIDEDEFASDRINILLLGLDNVEEGPLRSDTIILASLFPKEQQVKLLSLPRDTRLLIPGHGNDKLNHAYVYGGVNLVRRSVEEFTKIPIDYYIETNFQGFTNMVDILGGVTINVEKRMYYPEEDIDLQAGLQTLNGYDSLAYVRYRSDGMGDIGRIGRQQRFLKVLAENNLRASTVLKIPELVNELKDHVKTDLSVLEMVSIGNRFSKMDPANIEAYQVPGFSGMRNEVNYWIPDLNATKRIVDSMRRPTVVEEPEPASEETTET